MKKDGKKIIKKAYFLSACGILYAVGYFIFESYLKYWRNKHSGTSSTVNTIETFIIIGMLTLAHRIVTFSLKNFDILKSKKI